MVWARDAKKKVYCSLKHQRNKQGWGRKLGRKKAIEWTYLVVNRGGQCYQVPKKWNSVFLETVYYINEAIRRQTVLLNWNKGINKRCELVAWKRSLSVQTVTNKAQTLTPPLFYCRGAQSRIFSSIRYFWKAIYLSLPQGTKSITTLEDIRKTTRLATLTFFIFPYKKIKNKKLNTFELFYNGQLGPR